MAEIAESAKLVEENADALSAGMEETRKVTDGRIRRGEPHCVGC